MRARDHRLGRVKQAIEASPVRRGVLREAYEWFKDFGELDDDDHVAYEVVQQALRGGEEQAPEDEARLAKRVRADKSAYHQRERPAEAWPPTVRGMLFDEALFEEPGMRRLARAAIALEVTHGGDVESPGFAARHGIPMFGTVSLHIWGWPKKLVQPPYEFQAKRLLARLDNIRGRVPQDDPRWFEEQGKAIVRFRQTGELPDDDLHLDAVLVDVEMDALRAHKKGRNVAELMALLDKVQRREGAEQEEALKRVCAMAKEGRLP